MFGCQKIDTALNTQMLQETSHQNENVRANSKIFREILRTLINATYFLAGQELPFKGHDESVSSCNRGNYIEFLEYTRSYDRVLLTIW